MATPIVTMREVFDNVFEGIKINDALCLRMIRYVEAFILKNENHSAFFGDGLLGVNRVRFTPSDRDTWYDEVLGIDSDKLDKEFKKVTALVDGAKVMGEAINHTPSYVAFCLLNSKGIKEDLKREAIISGFMFLHIRYLTSLLSTRFRHDANKEIAQAVFNSLNGRYDIRKYGTWKNLIRARAEAILDKDGIFYKPLLNFEPDSMLIRIATDTQSRLRELVKKIYAIHLEIKDKGAGIVNRGDIVESAEGERILKDRKGGYAEYLNYVGEVVPVNSEFIKDELVDIITSGVKNLPRPLLLDSLNYVSNNYTSKKDGIAEIIDKLILYCFNTLYTPYMQNHRRNDVGYALNTIKNLLTAGRSGDVTVLELRSDMEEIVRKAINSKNAALVSTVRTGVLLYIFARVITRSHFKR